MFRTAKHAALNYFHRRLMTTLGMQWALKDASDVSFEGKTLQLDVRPTFSQKYLGPDLSRKLIAWLGVSCCVAFIGLVIFDSVTRSWEENEPHEELTERAIFPIGAGLAQVTAAAMFFSFLRRKRLKVRKVLLSRDGMKVVHKKGDTLLKETFAWQQIEEVVKVMGVDDEPLQLNVMLDKRHVATIYAKQDIQGFLKFLNNHVTSQIAGVCHHYAYSLGPVLAFAVAAAFCTYADYLTHKILRFLLPR